MTNRRSYLQNRVGEMLKLLGWVREQKMQKGGLDAVMLHEVAVLHYALENLAEHIPAASFPLDLVEAEYAAIRKALLDLVVRAAQKARSMLVPQMVTYDYAIPA